MEDAELKNDDLKEINDEKLDQVAGGALFLISAMKSMKQPVLK